MWWFRRLIVRSRQVHVFPRTLGGLPVRVRRGTDHGAFPGGQFPARAFGGDRSVDDVLGDPLAGLHSQWCVGGDGAGEASASSRTRSGAVTRLIRPRVSARWAEIGSPVNMSSRAILGGICCGRRNTPPAPAMIPRLTSGSPNSVGGCDSDVAGEDQLGSTAERDPVHGRDGRLRDPVRDVAGETPRGAGRLSERSLHRVRWL